MVVQMGQSIGVFFWSEAFVRAWALRTVEHLMRSRHCSAKNGDFQKEDYKFLDNQDIDLDAHLAATSWGALNARLNFDKP